MIGWGTIVTYLFLHSGYNLGSGVSYLSPPSSSSPPKWTLWLESWSRAFCAQVWPMLEADHANDNQVFKALELYRKDRERDGADWEELSGLDKDLQVLLDRGLHVTRKRYLDYHLSTAATPTSESEILRAAEIGDLDLFCGLAAGTALHASQLSNG
ncbi:hypothetical protein JCM10213v2_008548 [Rhodosporidiobolus nylandii]